MFQYPSCAQQKGAAPALRAFFVGFIQIKHYFAFSVHTVVDGCSLPYSSATGSSINFAVLQLAQVWEDAFLKLRLRCESPCISQVDRSLQSEIILILTIKQTGQEIFQLNSGAWLFGNMNTQSGRLNKFSREIQHVKCLM